MSENQNETQESNSVLDVIEDVFSGQGLVEQVFGGVPTGFAKALKVVDELFVRLNNEPRLVLAAIICRAPTHRFFHPKPVKDEGENSSDASADSP